MWWQALPSFFITGGFLILPGFSVYAMNWLFLGTGFKRQVISREEGLLYIRDIRISGSKNPYKQIGLEGLGPEDEKC